MNKYKNAQASQYLLRSPERPRKMHKATTAHKKTNSKKMDKRQQ